MLKPMLARGELRCIGATTLDEYRKHIEKDAALERRFQPVLVGEPTVEDTISILRGLRERYEQHHKVRIKDSALVAAAVLSHRYIADRFLPDKAIDLVDEAAAKLRMEATSMPVELDEVRRRIMQLEIEREALRKERDQASQERLQRIEAGACRTSRSRPTRSRRAGSTNSSSSTGSASCESDSTRPATRWSRRRCGPTGSGPPACRYEISQIEQRAGRGRAGHARARRTVRRSSRKRSTKRTSPRSSAAGPASRSAG